MRLPAVVEGEGLTGAPGDAGADPASPGWPRSPRRAAFGRWGLRMLGWRVAGEPPRLRSCVLVIAPHTSNWDFVIGLLACFALDLRGRWLGKHTIFRWPVDRLWRAWGGIPVDRAHPGRAAEDAAALLRDDPGGAWLALSPEGTRRPVGEWKSGYHRIARAAGVPLVPVTFDYGARAVRWFPPFAATDLARDEAHLRALFRGSVPRHPENYVP